jgi:hypothetical protein
MTQESISFEYFHWGPLICKYKTDLIFANKLTKLGRARKDNDYRQNLAGHIDHEFGFTTDDQQAFVKWYGKYFDSYVAEYASRFGENLGGLELESLWINFMKAGDFNPPHTHSGHISFVLFTSDMDDLTEEQEAFKGTGPKPGSIIFTYGEGLYTNTPMWSIINHYNVPKKGDLYIFPSLTKHWVAPFKTDMERVSISGNLIFKEKMGYAGGQ